MIVIARWSHAYPVIRDADRFNKAAMRWYDRAWDAWMVLLGRYSALGFDESERV